MDAEHIESYLSGELDKNGRSQVDRVLRNDLDLRESFLQQAQVDAALEMLLGEPEPGTDSSSEEFNASVMASLRSEGAGEYRSFAKSVLTEIVEERDGIIPLRWPDLLKAGVISAAASIALMFLLQGIIFREGAPASRGDASPAATPSFVARVEHGEGLEWSPTTAAKMREDGWVGNGLLELVSGKARIVFNSGASIYFEGPASLSIESNNRVFLQRGRLTADVPPPATGFTVNTPRLNAVDIGTRFGVRVSENGDSELHVMEGEVEASRASGNAVAALVREGSALRADGRTRNKLESVPYAGDEFLLQVGRPSDPQPRLRYTFDESVGAVVEDTGSDRLYDVPLVAAGNLENSPRRAAGKRGGGLVLQPQRSLEVALSRDFRLEGPFTIAFWVKIPPEVGSEENQVLLHYGREGSDWNFSCHLGSERGSRGALRIDYGEGYVVGSTDIADGNWHHVTCRFIGGEDADISSHVHLFINGVPETISDFLPGRISGGRAGSLKLGSDLDNGLSGWMDEVIVFLEAIPTATIQELPEE